MICLYSSTSLLCLILFRTQMEDEGVLFIDPLKPQQELVYCYLPLLKETQIFKSSLLSSISIHTLQRGKDSVFATWTLENYLNLPHLHHLIVVRIRYEVKCLTYSMHKTNGRSIYMVNCLGFFNFFLVPVLSPITFTSYPFHSKWFCKYMFVLDHKKLQNVNSN